MRSDRRTLALLAILAVLPACTRTLSERSAVDQHAEDEAAFWIALESERTLTNHDALHGLFLLADGDDPHASFEERVAAARERGWLDAKDANPVANESVTVGRIAHAAAHIADVKGGLTMRIAGPSPRYATRELVFLNLLPDRTENQSMSGLEFIDLVGRLQDYMSDAEKRSLQERLERAAPAEQPPAAGPNQEEATPTQGA